MDRKFRIITAGTSSIDPTANTPGLHRFKLKMGFEAVPVRREFCFHPLLRPAVNKLGLSIVGIATKRFSFSRFLKLTRLVLEHVLQSPGSSILHLQADPNALGTNV